jgi:sugar diacid utilization regulator
LSGRNDPTCEDQRQPGSRIQRLTVPTGKRARSARGDLASDDLLLERALLSDERLQRAAVDREFGPILGAPRNGGELLRTVAAYIASSQNLRTAARELGVGRRDRQLSPRL